MTINIDPVAFLFLCLSLAGGQYIGMELVGFWQYLAFFGTQKELFQKKLHLMKTI